MSTVGISDIAIYIPSPSISTKAIQNMRGAQNAKQYVRLGRAIETTGQKAIRIPEPWEDSVTLAAESLKMLFDACAKLDMAAFRYFAVGTESSVDMSKAMSSYISGLLERAGYVLPHALSNFQVQHACAGGTIGVIAVASMLQVASVRKEKGLVICTDIARYEADSSAEITQGAGAASLLIEKEPRLLEIDLETQGYSSTDVDDFFRPLGRSTAQVKGRYSIQCYNSALDEALADHAARSKVSIAQILSQTTYFVFHVPFPQIAVMSIKRLLHRHVKMDENEIQQFLQKRGFYRSLETTAAVGNMYNAALYLNMATQLSESYAEHANEIVGKKMLIFSYGSGSTMLLVSATVAEGAPRQIEKWKLKEALAQKREISWEEYEHWMQQDIHISTNDSTERSEQALTRLLENSARTDSFYLKNIRADGYREYDYLKSE